MLYKLYIFFAVLILVKYDLDLCQENTVNLEKIIQEKELSILVHNMPLVDFIEYLKITYNVNYIKCLLDKNYQEKFIVTINDDLNIKLLLDTVVEQLDLAWKINSNIIEIYLPDRKVDIPIIVASDSVKKALEKEMPIPDLQAGESMGTIIASIRRYYQCPVYLTGKAHKLNPTLGCWPDFNIDKCSLEQFLSILCEISEPNLKIIFRPLGIFLDAK